MRTIFDGHLDLSWNALSWGRDITLDLDELNRGERAMTDHPARGRATTTLPEMRRGAIAVCQATVLCRARPEGRPHDGPSRLSLDFANQEIASATARGQLAYYELLERRGLLRMIRTATELDAHMRRWADDPDSTPIGYILAMEGADPIVDVDHAAAWWELGLRSVNLAHYGKSWYAVGTGGDGPLTPDGIRLLKEFERLGMILDATHLSDTSFFQALDTFGGPVLASHNNCRELVPDGRQFSDEQIRRLIGRGAVIGAALDAWMLAPGWIRGQTRATWSGSMPWPTTSTTSASSPATPATPPSAATSTAASGPSRSPPASIASPTSRSSTPSSPAADIPPRRSTPSSTATGCGSSGSTCRAEPGSGRSRSVEFGPGDWWGKRGGGGGERMIRSHASRGGPGSTSSHR